MSASMKRPHNGDFAGPAAKRTPSVTSAQRELQIEKEKHARTQESVVQLRMEMQMMGRLLAAAREQISTLGGEALAPDVSVQLPPEGLIPELTFARAPAAEGEETADEGAAQSISTGESKRLQQDLTEAKMQCKRLHEQAAALQHKNRSLSASKKELAAIVQDMQDYLSKNRP
tara:strand:- start:1156 stop:1674 length:519 start_codon:yes stop_codon:yes gene_type:complete